MTTSVHTISRTVLVCAAVLLAIAFAPGRAFATVTIEGKTFEGTQSEPVVIDDSFNSLEKWELFKAALELEENLYIRVETPIGNGTLPELAPSFKAGDPLITIPEGYSKDVELADGYGVGYSKVDDSTNKYVPFGCMILNEGSLTVHSSDYAELRAMSSNDDYSVIRNEGNLCFYGKAGVEASFASTDKYGAKYGRGIYCASDDAVLVISGEGWFTGKSFGQLVAWDVAAGVFVQKAKSVDIFGGLYRHGGFSTWYEAGIAVSAALKADTVKLHGGKFMGFVVVDTEDVSTVTFESYLGKEATFNDTFSGVSPSFVARDFENHLVSFKATDGDATVFEVEAGLLWNTVKSRAKDGVRLNEFTAGDGVVYEIPSGGTAYSSAVGYESKDSTVTMATEPVWPVDGLGYQVDSIGDFAFSSNWDIKAVELPAYLRSIGMGAFSASTISAVTLNDALRTIGDGAFAETNLVDIGLPYDVEEIGESAFEGTKIASVALPPNVTKLGERAFLGSHLSKISNMNAGEMTIGAHAYGYYEDKDGNYVMVKPFVVNAMPDSPFWQDAVKKGFIADLRTASVGPIPNQPFVGSEVEPKPVVTVDNDLGTVTLEEGVDYELTYEKNDAIGKATAIITALDPPNYGGTTATFDIVQASMLDATVDPIPNQTYTGKAITPKVTATIGDVELKEGTDYTVEYKNNVKVGTATIILKGKGYLTGTKTVTFLIVESVPTEWKRLSGDTALDTMAKIVDEGSFYVGGTVVLASLEGYWDALTAAGIAGLETAPVLMVLQDSVPAQTADLLKKIKPATIIVCGGTYWIPDSVVEAAKKAAGNNPHVLRLAGANAADTACKIAAQGKGLWGNTAIVATAGTFQDALAAAPVAYANAIPIFLAQFDFATEKGYIDKATIKGMKDIGIDQCYIVGGTYWLPESVTKDLEAAGITVLGQLGGKTAVETSALIAQLGIDKFGMTADAMGVADVQKHYDALASAAFCGRNDSVLVLTLDEKSSVIEGFVKSHKSSMTKAYIFGGTSSVSEKTAAALKNVTK